ncbi:MAG: AzlC family ABC transporter permease [Desulfobacterales bacterium]|nr:AzlC family ABC transporter permease [Desulfobacterales bacterium]
MKFHKDLSTNTVLPGWLLSALQQSLPVILGYLPIGFAYGVLAQKSGLSGFNTAMMSLLVFAGSAQLIAVGLLASGAGPATVILTTFMVNLRHLLMSASLAPFLRSWSRIEQAFFSFQLTDETFALHSSRFTGGRPLKKETLAINVTAQSAWLAGTCMGLFAGSLISDMRPIGLDFALPAMFIVLLVWQVKSLLFLFTAVAAGVCSLALILLGLGQSSVIIATVIAATLGLAVETWIKKKYF